MVAVARINAEGTSRLTRRLRLFTVARMAIASAEVDARSPAKAKLADITSLRANPPDCVRIVISNATYRISAMARSKAQRLIQRSIECLIESGSLDFGETTMIKNATPPRAKD